MPHVIIHRIFSLPVSLPVRGADGLAKRATYGGIERQRLSSQSVKAHLRAATGLPRPMADLAATVGADMSVRSALIGPRRIDPALKVLGLDPEAAATWADAVMALFQTGKEKAPSESVTPRKARRGAKASTQIDDQDGGEPVEDAESETRMVGGGRQVLTLGEAEKAPSPPWRLLCTKPTLRRLTCGD
jgi:CT1975-like protein